MIQLKRFPIVKHSILWLTISAAVAVISAFIFFKYQNLSIQFTGGMEIKVNAKLDQEKTQEEIKAMLENEGYTNPGVSIGTKDGYDTILLQIPVDNQEKVTELGTDIQTYLLNNKYIDGKDDILEQSIIGASIGEYVKNSTLWALGLGFLFIALYIAFAFMAVRNFISPVILGLLTLSTLFFDIALPAGAYGILMAFNSTIQVDTIFVLAILTIMGYSINDTIIIFDRIRENMKTHSSQLAGKKMTYEKLFDDSIWQTMRRTLGTSLSTFLVVICMRIFGTGTMQSFAFLIGIGIIAGTLSSIFIAASFSYVIIRYIEKKK